MYRCDVLLGVRKVTVSCSLCLVIGLCQYCSFFINNTLFKLPSKISFSVLILVYVGVNSFVSLFRQLNLKKVLVSGGHLDYKVNPQHLKENGGLRIYILALDQAGRVSCFFLSPSIAASGQHTISMLIVLSPLLFPFLTLKISFLKD